MSRDYITHDRCSDCGAELPTDRDRSCSKCGSTRFDVTLSFEESLQIRELIAGRVKDPSYNSRKNPRVTFKVGASYSTCRKKWMDLRRLVDRNNDLYLETVTDPETGEIVHRCEEPLSRHRSHGSAKTGAVLS